jgi:dTMP kinase
MPVTPPRSGLLVTFEGGEGAGKSTTIGAASSLLARRDVRHRVTREPGGTPLGEGLRQLVLDPRHGGMCPESELLIFFAARAQHVVETIQPTLSAGDWVISDRFTDASYAYQGGGRGLPVQTIAELERWAVFGLRPDLTFLFDVPVDEGLRRIAGRAATDRVEREAVPFFERVREAYRARAAAEPARFCIINALRPLPDVVAAVERELTALVERWRAGDAK